MRRRRRMRRRREQQAEEEAMEGDEDIPIDILENMRGRSTRDHVSDEAVGREIERRYAFCKKYIFNTF